MHDGPFTGFLARQRELGAALAAASPLLRLVPLDGDPPRRYLAHFTCRGLVRHRDGEIVAAESFLVGIRFTPEYLYREQAVRRAVAWLGPAEAFHPNIRASAQAICLGNVPPGSNIDLVLEQCFRVITWRKVTMHEGDALDPAACAWARRNGHRFPVDTRPLRTRAPVIEARDAAAGGGRGRS